VVTAGRLSPGKGIDVLLEAIAVLPAKAAAKPAARVGKRKVKARRRKRR